MNIAYLSLGTNLGNKLENLNKSIDRINTLGKVIKTSSVYQTPPWGFKSDDFFNIALTLETSLKPDDLILKLLDFETELGRTRDHKNIGYQARPLDIDIIFFNDNIINSKNLIIPHPRMQDRNFVLIPLIEIVSNYNHPILNKTLENLHDECNDEGKIIKTNYILNS